MLLTDRMGGLDISLMLLTLALLHGARGECQNSDLSSLDLSRASLSLSLTGSSPSGTTGYYVCQGLYRIAPQDDSLSPWYRKIWCEGEEWSPLNFTCVYPLPKACSDFFARDSRQLTAQTVSLVVDYDGPDYGHKPVQIACSTKLTDYHICMHTEGTLLSDVDLGRSALCSGVTPSALPDDVACCHNQVFSTDGRACLDKRLASECTSAARVGMCYLPQYADSCCQTCKTYTQSCYGFDWVDPPPGALCRYGSYPGGETGPDTGPYWPIVGETGPDTGPYAAGGTGPDTGPYTSGGAGGDSGPYL